MLDDKLRNHPTIIAKTAELEKFTDIKDKFAEITDVEPEVQSEPED